MELNEIFKLIDAGYTKADIEALSTAQTPAPADPEPAPAPAPEPTPTPEQPKDQTPQVLPGDAGDDRYKTLEAKLNQLIGMQQGKNINADIGASDQVTRTPTDILGSVIAPPRKDTKK